MRPARLRGGGVSSRSKTGKRTAEDRLNKAQISETSPKPACVKSFQGAAAALVPPWEKVAAQTGGNHSPI